MLYIEGSSEFGSSLRLCVICKVGEFGSMPVLYCRGIYIVWEHTEAWYIYTHVEGSTYQTFVSLLSIVFQKGSVL